MRTQFSLLLVSIFLFFIFLTSTAVAAEDEHGNEAEEKIPIAFSIGCHGGLVGLDITGNSGSLLGHGDCHAGLDIHGHTENGQWFEIDIGPALGLHVESNGVAVSGGGVIDTRWALPRGNFRLYAGLEIHADAEDAQIALNIVPHIETRRSFGIGARIEWGPTTVPRSHPSGFSGLSYAELNLGVVLRLETGHMSRGIYELMIMGSRAGFNGTDWCRGSGKCGSLTLQLRVGFDHHITKPGQHHDHADHDDNQHDGHTHEEEGEDHDH